MGADIVRVPTRAAADLLVAKLSAGPSDRVFRSVPSPAGGFVVRGWTEAETRAEGEASQRFVEDMSA